jgi:hypothetical protein
MAVGDSTFSLLKNASAFDNPSLTIYIETDLQPSELYRFKISSSNIIGEGPISNEIEVISASLPNKP